MTCVKCTGYCLALVAGCYWIYVFEKGIFSFHLLLLSLVVVYSCCYKCCLPVSVPSAAQGVISIRFGACTPRGYARISGLLVISYLDTFYVDILFT